MTERIRDKLARFEKALQLFLERVRADSNLLAAVLVGSLPRRRSGAGMQSPSGSSRRMA